MLVWTSFTLGSRRGGLPILHEVRRSIKLSHNILATVFLSKTSAWQLLQWMLRDSRLQKQRYLSLVACQVWSRHVTSLYPPYREVREARDDLAHALRIPVWNTHL